MTKGKRASLAENWQSFEGLVPAVVATAARDGTPNVSYISQIYYIDEGHVALSNQFMSKTVMNVLENPRLHAVVINPATGLQANLALMFERAETAGPLFDQFAASISAISAHRGMEHIMRLRSADIYRVIDFVVEDVEDASRTIIPQSRHNPLAEAAGLSLALSKVEDLDQAIDLVLEKLVAAFGMRHCMVLLFDIERCTLTAIASRGYEMQGAGAEVELGKGVIGMAAAKACSMRFSDVGRHFLYADNVGATAHLSIDTSRVIPLPGLEDPLSLLAVPMIASGEVRGVIFAESTERLAFTPFDEQAIALIASQLAGLVAYTESSRELDAALAQPAPSKPLRTNGTNINVHRHSYDDSLFINNAYVIKGVPGRILWRMLQLQVAEGRTEFTNREFRMDATLKLPEFKDNLETRLLLLSRRLAEKNFGVRIDRSGRGRVTLQVEGKPILTEETSN